MKIIIIVGGLAVFLLFGGVWYSNNATRSDSTVISNKGIHLHSTLKIYINGKKQDIPANIGIVGEHSPMHTHSSNGVIHIEYEGVVREDDIKLGNFFKIWGKKFNSDQLFGYKNGEGKDIHMFVNGKESKEFDNYSIKNGDTIILRYE